MALNQYYSGQGILYEADRDAEGKPMGFRPLGNIPSLEISVEVEKFEHKESTSGQRAVDLVLVQEKNGTFTMTMEGVTPKNLAMVFWGQHTDIASAVGVVATVKGYTGLRTVLPYPRVSAVVVEDEAEAVTYVEDTDYTVDYVNGAITVIEGGGITNGEILVITFNHAANEEVIGFTETSLEKYLRFEGLNTVDNARVIVEIYKANLDPLQSFGLINEELSSFEVSGNILFDDLQTGDSKFFRQIFADSANVIPVS